MSKEKLLKTSKKTGELLLNTTLKKNFFGKVWILGSKIKRNDGGLSFMHSTVWPVCSSWLSSGWDVPMPSCFFCCKIPHFPILWHCQFNLLSSKRNIALHSYNNRFFLLTNRRIPHPASFPLVLHTQAAWRSDNKKQKGPA